MPTIESTFHKLMMSPKELQTELDKNPNLIKQQDEKGRTLLHHAVEAGYIMGRSNVGMVLDVLLNTPGIDFTIEDNKRMTPLQLAAKNCIDNAGRFHQETADYIFPTLIRAAKKKASLFLLGTRNPFLIIDDYLTKYSQSQNEKLIKGLQGLLEFKNQIIFGENAAKVEKAQAKESQVKFQYASSKPNESKKAEQEPQSFKPTIPRKK
ncbi:MAG: hypothetical protein A3F11_11025 [Gammaproteobacteria bacterium RIFCSPHIGHO2_12_FULL_37_14]|nr:MAG: hypothetical protein A3F11_11025 [Gammaproteobacteria bacterium RIFCSPHIGHO2_12_FULL_37_14]